MELQPFLELVSQVGVTGVLAWLAWNERKDRKAAEEKLQKQSQENVKLFQEMLLKAQQGTSS